MLTVEGVDKSFSGRRVLRNINLTVPAGSVTVLLGPSGCGKTTLLRVVAGLEIPESGRVLLRGDDLAGVPPHRRGMGMVFQDYALFPHMDVTQNVAFGLRMAGWDARRIARRVADALDWVGLAGFGSRETGALSGGEQQRIALARSLAPAPRLLLLDEPLGALDRALRERLLSELPGILAAAGQAMGYDAGITALYVTHDQTEAFALANQVVVIDQGAIVQSGAPQAVYDRPASEFVARFLGMGNILEATVRSLNPPRVDTAHGPLAVPDLSGRDRGDRLPILLRPEAVRVAAQGPEGAAADPPPDLIAVVVRRTFRGRFQTLAVRLGDDVLSFELAARAALPAEGEPIALWLDPSLIIPLAAEQWPA